MAQEITLPVKLLLENLQSIMKEMRSQLGTLKVDSSGYKKLEGVINGIEKRIQDIQIIASRPIMDGKLFIAIEKDVSHIYDDITKLGMEAGKIKFSDLLLTGDQKAKLQEFDNQLKTIKDDLKNIELKAKEAFLSTDAGKLWQEQNPELATKSFSRITDIIETEVIKQKKAVEDAKKAYNDYQNTILISKNINSFMRSKNSLTDRIKAAGMYDKIFTADGSRFKNGGRNALEGWLKSEFSLSDDAIKSITLGSGAQVLKAFTEMKDNVRAALKSELNRLSAERKNAIDITNNGKTLTDKIANEEAKQLSILAVLNAATLATEARAQAEAHLRLEEEATLAARSAYITSLTKETQAQLKMGNSCELAKAQLASLNNTVKEGLAKLASLDSATNRLQGISNFVNRYVGAYAIIRKVTTAIRNAFNNIKELDKTITSIAVVTNMSQEDLWNKVGQYTQMAQEYGVTTNDVYKVSQLFYQQGLLTSQVMSLTTETLKMAKIAGMDYTQATNAMTVAVRAFNIEMDQAQQVTDTYSALAAKFAVSSAEIANAMEKTASSAANVGMSIQSTSAFMSVMIQTTRESAQNIGSALKSIISRYGEMKASPASLINVDGEEVAFNKVDTALKSVGISIKDASGQFRDFDDVIMELAAKWNTLDNNTQRYIATIMAGNRLQSRFIALVSNYDELSRAMNVANNAENASIVQVAKTMDSLESKTNQLKNAFSQLYLDLHIEAGLKDIYDWLTRIITTVSKLGTLTGAIPTLMNIFGFGTGLKGTIKAISDNIQAKKLKIETDNSEFERKKEEIEAYLANPHDLNVKVNVDDSLLQGAKNEIMFMNNSALASAATTTAGLFALLGNIAGADSATRLNTIMSALTSGKLSTEESRKKFLTEDMKMDEESPIFNDFMLSLEKLANSAKQAGMNLEGLGDKSNNSSKAVDNLGKTSDAAGQQTQGAGQKIDNAGLKAEEAGDKFRSAGNKADSSKKDWQTNVMKGAMIFSAAARLLGTAITAAGASHLDRSTDNLETSKLLTGVGNGLSMAGTGALLGMMTGQWWGPIVGAISGFLIGGLGAIIDGAKMDLGERIALLREEAKKAVDESLKKLAKVTDLSNQIDNIESLRKAMYNSTDDMLAYKDAMNTMASLYPMLISSYDEAGNAIIELNNAERELINLRLLSALSTRTASLKEAATKESEIAAGLTLLDSLNNATKYGVFGLNSYYDNDEEKYEEFINGIESWFESNPNYKTYTNFTEELKASLRNISNSSPWQWEYEDLAALYSAVGDVIPNLGDIVSNWKPDEAWTRTQVVDILSSKWKDFLTALNDTSATVESYFGWGEDWKSTLSLDELEQAKEKLLNEITLWSNGLSAALSTADNAFATEEVQSLVQLAEFTDDRKAMNLLSSDSIFSSWYYEYLMLQMDGAAENLDKWKELDLDAYNDAINFARESFISLFKDATENDLKRFIEATSNLTKYTTAELAAEATGIELIEEDHNAFEELFIRANLANRNRILSLIYGEDYQSKEEISIDDTALNNLLLLKSGSEILSDIGEAFEENGGIMTDYAQYFSDLLLDINNLAELGYTQLASGRLNILHSLANTLSSITDSNVQQDLFSTLITIDFSNYDTLVSAYESIEAYNKENGNTTEVNTILLLLKLAQNDLIFNINTLALDLTDLISSAAKEMDGILGTNSSGLDLSKALSALSDLNAGRSVEDVLGFDTIFEYDAALNKYVYTAKGLLEAISKLERKLLEEAEQLDNSLKNYISSDTLNNLKKYKDYANKELESKDLLTSDDLLQYLSGLNLSNPALTLYQGFTKDFLDSDLPKTFEAYIDYLVELGEDAVEAKKIVDLMRLAYENNKKNQYFQNIDWSALALGTDYYGTNQAELSGLITELNKNLSEDALLSANATYLEVLEAYLATIENELVRETTRAKINDEIIQTKTSLYQTAISEIINYSSGLTLSQATKDLFNNAKVAEHLIANSAKTAILTAKGFLEELAKSIGLAGYTLEQYNQDAKSILEATLNNGSKEKSLLDFISEDSIGADTLEGLANVFGKRLDELVNVATGLVQGQLGQYMSYDFLAGKYNINGTFELFIEALLADFGIIILKGTKLYIEALKTWNERVINENNEIHNAVSEEINKVLSAKGGDLLNLALTFGHLNEEVNQKLTKTLIDYGADLSGGILTIHDGADIPAIVQELANVAAENGLLIPEELRALTDAINDVLDSMVSNIKSGIKGTLSRSGARDLATWAKNNLDIKLDFTRTKEGLKISTEQTELLYNELVKVDSITALIVLDLLNTSIQESNGSLGTTQALLKRTQELTENIKYENGLKTYANASREARNVDIFNLLNGNVDLYNRNKLYWDDGSYSTILTETLESRNFQSNIPWVMNITPIPPKASTVKDILSEDELNDYILGLLDQNPLSGTALLELDKVENGGKGLIINLKEAKEVTDDLVNSMDNEALVLHEVSEVYEAIQNGEKYDDTKISLYEKELLLNREIMELRATSADSSFKFMENAIPAAQENPLNYWENWAKAMKAIETAGKNSNQIDYRDFYNIVTEMGNLASETNPIKVSGEHILTNCQDAANLIELAAGALTVASDGSIKVDLSQIGIDFVSGAKDMKLNVGKGILEVANSLIEMLDGMIQLLETIVAMEELSKIDLDDNGLEFDELFSKVTESFGTNTELYKWTEGALTASKNILDMADKLGTDSDLYKGLLHVKIGEKSMYDILESAKKGATINKEQAQAYHAALAAFYQAMQSGDYDLDHIYDSIKEVLAGTDYEGEITVGDLHLVFHNGAVFEKDQDGNIIYNNKTYTGPNAIEEATAAYKNDALNDILNGVLSEPGKEVTTTANKGAVIITSLFNVETKKFEAKFSDGGVVSSDTAEGLSAAILHYSYMQQLELDEITGANSETLSYTILREGEVAVDWVLNVKTGKSEVLFKNPLAELTAAERDLIKASEGYQYTAQVNENTNVELDGVNLSVKGDSTATIDLSNVTVTPEGLDTIKLTTIPPLTPGDGASVTIDLEGLIPDYKGTLLPISYDTLEAAITTINASYNDLPNKDNVILTTIDYDCLTAAIEEVLAQYNDAPTTDGIILQDSTYSKALGIILSSIVLKRGASTKVSNTIRINGNEVTISDTINALLTGTLLVNGNGVTVSTGSITLANGSKVDIPAGTNLKGIITELMVYGIGVTTKTGKITLANGSTVEIPEGTEIGTQISLLKVDGNGVTTETGTITIANGLQVEIPAGTKIGTQISKLFADGTNVKIVEGELTIDDKAIIPLDESIRAAITTLLLLWAEGEHTVNTDGLNIEKDIYSDNTITYHLKVNVVAEEYDKEVNDFRNKAFVYNKSNFYDWLKSFGIDDTGSGHTDFITSGSVLDKYVSSLEDMLRVGKSLSKVDISNISKIVYNSSSTWLTDDTRQRLLNILNLNLINTNDLANLINNLKTIDGTGMETLAIALDTIYSSLLNLDNFDFAGLVDKINSFFGMETPNVPEISEISDKDTNIEITDNTDVTKNNLKEVSNTLDEINSKKTEVAIEESATNKTTKQNTTNLFNLLQELDKYIAHADIETNANDVLGPIQSVLLILQSISGSYNADVNIKTKGAGALALLKNNPKLVGSDSPARGTIGIGDGTINSAKAKGTLMGELGPELVVSNGRYFVAGLNGAEFVDLNNDAIVFNHLQTELLLKHGMSTLRGQAVTNERNAVSFATGNVNGGPAMASARAALAALKQLRAQWQAIAGMSAKDLAGLGGSGGGGGGGKKSDPKVFIKLLEIWYNWLQRIAVLEEKINYEEAKRNELASNFNPNGREYVKSLKETLDYLKEEAAVHQSLVESLQEYFNLRRAEMNSALNPFSALYTFDEYGQLKYKDRGLEQLSLLVGRDALTGQGNMTAQELYNRLVSMGYGRYMDYDSSGNAIDKEQDDWYVSAVLAFWDKIDSDQKEMLDLHNSIEEHKKAVLELESKINDIIKEIEDNLIAIENKVLKAVEDMHQREIDEMQKERDAIEKSSLHLIDGLSLLLEKERDMYSTKENQEELTSLLRKLLILLRSNGSATEIAALLKELSLKLQETYFELQQQLIDALQEASDKLLEKLDALIDLMTETLEYLKLHGMLWEEVYSVLDGTPEEITNFITEHDSQYWGQSPTDFALNARETLFEALKFTALNEILGSISNIVSLYDKKAIEEEARKKREEEERLKAAAAAAALISLSSSGGSSSSSGSSGASNSNSSKNNDNTSTTWKPDDKVSGRMYEVDSNGKATGAIKYDDTGLANINTAAGLKALEAARTRAILTEEKKIESAKTILSLPVSTAAQASATKQIASSTSAIKNLKKLNNVVKKAAAGGYVGHGIYELGELGTETVLTAEQTLVLRNNILSNRPNSLISLLKSYNEGYNGINDNIKDVHKITDNSTVIEHATVEMHVASIANDYDAQRAGEQALEKMLSIARKTAGLNRIGR